LYEDTKVLRYFFTVKIVLACKRIEVVM